MLTARRRRRWIRHQRSPVVRRWLWRQEALRFLEDLRRGDA